MSDADKSMLDVLPHDGWTSRKFLMTAIGFVVVGGVASVAMFTGRMDPGTWVNLMQWLWPLSLGIFAGTSVWEKFAYRRG